MKASAAAIGVALLALGAAFYSTAQAAQRSRHKSEPQRQIACTVLGCIPVPRQCFITYGRTMKGTPTGYDVIVCPPGIWPLK